MKDHNFRHRDGELKKGIACNSDANSVDWTLIDNGKLANQIATFEAIVVK